MAAEANACAKELTTVLKQRMVTQKSEAAECIQMVRKLGEPIESLQVCDSKLLYDVISSAVFQPTCCKVLGGSLSDHEDKQWLS